MKVLIDFDYLKARKPLYEKKKYRGQTLKEMLIEFLISVDAKVVRNKRGKKFFLIENGDTEVIRKLENLFVEREAIKVLETV